MSKEDDGIFLRNFGLVLLGLVAIAFVAFFLARTVTNSAQSSGGAAVVQIESITRIS